MLAAKIVSLEPSVVDAEHYARQAYDQAKKNAADRADHQKKMDAESKSVSVATGDCGSSGPNDSSVAACGRATAPSM